jgi:hypothetical protein
MPRDPTPGAATAEKLCEGCGRVTVHEWVTYRGDRRIGEADESYWVCRGLSRADLAAGR